jgi:cytochrome c peroxidase
MSMRRSLGVGIRTLVALAAPLGLIGCGGTGKETATATASRETSGGEARGGPARDAASAKDGPAELVTPNRTVDPRSLVDVVKEEVKGGESQLGPTPSNHLWLPADESLIKDEPLTVGVPAGLDPITAYVPSANPMTRGKVELGKQLYFDPRVSKDGTVSCATCHNPEHGWTDSPLPTSIGIGGQVGGRNAPTVINTVYGRTMFWDGRAPSLEGQAQGPIQNPIEMGTQSYKEIIDRLRTISGYTEQFQKVFGTEATLDGMAKAIAAFERSAALSGNSKYDRYIKGDMKALSESEKRGMVLFGLRLDQDDDFKTDVVLKKADCTSCHIGRNFTDEQFHNLGIGWDEKGRKFADLGRWAISPIGAKNPRELGAFKTPTVRDVTRTAPYMHDGSLATLEAVVDHYDKGGHPNPALDKDIKKLNLTEQERKDVVAFMKALTGEMVPVALPTLPVGPDGKTPDPRSALHAPGPRTAAGVHPGMETGAF